MDKLTTGTVISVHRQSWLKVNTRPLRASAMDGAIFPYIVRVRYTVDGKDYTKLKWLPAGSAPHVGDLAQVSYCEAKPKKAKISLVLRDGFES